MNRLAIVGAGHRALTMYLRPLRDDFSESARIVGICDSNPLRAAYLAREVPGVPAFDDFDVMMRATSPDTVIVTTIDREHDRYVVAALEAGARVICEKPLAIDAAKVRAILDAQARTGRSVTVTFNYRYVPYMEAIKRLVAADAIGRPLNVDFEWLLDRSHGADYFRRWHRRKENSGGLLVHKASHHFDLVNWWIASEPESVFARGDRSVYGPTRLERGDRCSTCAFTATCEFVVDLAAAPELRSLYFDAESMDGYRRDACVFDPEIDIEDRASVTVRYRSGAFLSYSLVAFSPYEGWHLSITGSRGRLEARQIESGPLAGEPTSPIRIFANDGTFRQEEVATRADGHWGADPRLRESLFGESPPSETRDLAATAHDGAMAAMVGIAANQSIAAGRPIRIADLLA
jgi:predicted dehydrogenase